jgi:hypothetical protein
MAPREGSTVWNFIREVKMKCERVTAQGSLAESTIKRIKEYIICNGHGTSQILAREVSMWEGILLMLIFVRFLLICPILFC